MPTVPTFAVRETDVSRHNGGTSGAPLKPLRVDSALRALSTLRGLREAPEVPPLCRETQSLGQQMLERWAKMDQGGLSIVPPLCRETPVLGRAIGMCDRIVFLGI